MKGVDLGRRGFPIAFSAGLIDPVHDENANFRVCDRKSGPALPPRIQTIEIHRRFEQKTKLFKC